LPPDQIVAAIDDSDASVDRLDLLMRDFLLFADPVLGNLAIVDLGREVQAALRLAAEELKRMEIQVSEQVPQQPAPIAMDPTRLRQSLHNLLSFAQYRAGKAGRIDVNVGCTDDGVAVSVVDSGPAMSVESAVHLYPFSHGMVKGDLRRRVKEEVHHPPCWTPLE
jgi:signal transduction histidine kinase